MRALNYHIVIREIKEKGHTVAGGLQLSTEYDKDLRYLKGKVISVGNRVIKEMEDETVKIEEGDTIWYDRHAGHEIRWTNNEPLKVLKLGDLVSIDK